MPGVKSQPSAAKRVRERRRQVRWWIVLLVASTVAVFAAPSEAAVRVVLRTPRPIWEFTAAGDRIAWIQVGACRRSYSVFRLNLRTRHQARLTSCFTPREAPVDVVLAGVRTMWSQSFGSRHVTASTLLTTARLGDKQVVATFRARGCGSDGCTQGVSGLKVLDGRLASGGNRLFYGVLDIAAGTTCSGGICDRIYTGGRVRRLTRIGPVTVPGAPAAAMLAARGGRLADVPLILGTNSFQPSHSIDILDAVTGAPIDTVTLPDDILEIALSRSILGVLTLTAGGAYEIRRYTSTGTFLGTTALTPIRHYGALLATGTKLVFKTKHAIFMMNAVTGVYRRIYLDAHTVSGLAVARDRVLWSGLWSPAAERTVFGMPLPPSP
jgi:hypothetical protein